MKEKVSPEEMDKKVELIKKEAKRMQEQAEKDSHFKRIYQSHLFTDKGVFRVVKSFGRGRYQIKELPVEEQKKILLAMGVGNGKA